jgi:uncharacterized membrane protein required for colicin V production
MIVDAAIIAFIGFFAWRGWRKGLVLTLAGLAGFVVAVIAAVFGYRALSAPLHSGFGFSKTTANLIAAVSIFILVSLVFWLAGRALTRMLRWTKWGTVNAAGGAALASVWAVSWVTVVLFALTVVPVPHSVSKNIANSTIGEGIVREAPVWTRAIARVDLRRMFGAFFPHENKQAV